MDSEVQSLCALPEHPVGHYSAQLSHSPVPLLWSLHLR